MLPWNWVVAKARDGILAILLVHLLLLLFPLNICLGKMIPVGLKLKRMSLNCRM